MIFVSVGSENFPFDRLLKELDRLIENGLIKDKVWAQIGCATYRPQYYEYSSFISFEEMKVRIKTSDMLIMHAGVGSTLLCFSLKKIPIIVPRKVSLREHLDDHQVEFAQKLKSARRACVALEMHEMEEIIMNYDALIAECKYESSGEKAALSLALKEIIHRRNCR